MDLVVTRNPLWDTRVCAHASNTLSSTRRRIGGGAPHHSPHRSRIRDTRRGLTSSFGSIIVAPLADFGGALAGPVAPSRGEDGGGDLCRQPLEL